MVYPSRFSRPSHRSAGLGEWWGSPGTQWFLLVVLVLQLGVLVVTAVDVVWRLAGLGLVLVVVTWMLVTRFRRRAG